LCVVQAPRWFSRSVQGFWRVWFSLALPSALVAWLSNELPARQVLPVAWLEKGAKPCRSDIRGARCGLPMPARENERGLPVAAVMIGVDPHKGSHTAVAIDAAERQLGTVRVRASACQAGKLVEWATEWPERTWAVEGAGGLGHLLAQQLLAAGEQVLDIQPKLGARVRLLSSGQDHRPHRVQRTGLPLGELIGDCVGDPGDQVGRLRHGRLQRRHRRAAVGQPLQRAPRPR
jgi:hypothetical protein